MSLDLDIQPTPEAQHPGQLPIREWSRNAVFHASHRGDWGNARSVHVGTQEAASDRLVQVSQNGQKEPHDDPAGGRIWARRLTSPPVQHLSDSQVNWAQQTVADRKKWQHSSPEDQIPVRIGAQNMRQGRTVSYSNSAEDVGSVSHVASPSSLRCWSDDVKEAQALGHDVHPWDAHLAEQGFDPEQAITPRSFSNTADTYMRDRERQTAMGRGSRDPGYRTEQRTFFPNSVGDTLFEERADDTDWDGWNTSPGRDASKRASAFAEQTGQQLGFGVRQTQGDRQLPPTMSRLPKRSRSGVL